jgi:hypothetical protein
MEVNDSLQVVILDCAESDNNFISGQIPNNLLAGLSADKSGKVGLE